MYDNSTFTLKKWTIKDGMMDMPYIYWRFLPRHITGITCFDWIYCAMVDTDTYFVFMMRYMTDEDRLSEKNIFLFLL